MSWGEAEVSPPLHFRPSLTERILVSAAGIFIGAVTIFMFVAAAASFRLGVFVGLFMLVISGVMVSLVYLVAKEAIARWRLEATLSGQRLDAVLTRRRGFIDTPRVKASIDLAGIDRIETRIEVFTELGLTTTQRAYRLYPKIGGPLFLGADRDMVAPFFAKLVDAIAARGGVPVVDLGVVDGDAGFLLVARQTAPDWTAPSLSSEQIAMRMKRRERTWALIIMLAVLVTLARALPNS